MSIEELVAIINEQKGIFEQDDTLLELRRDVERSGSKANAIASIASEEEHRVAVSEACHQFALGGTWPPLPPQQQIHIYARLLEAATLLWAIQSSAQLRGAGLPLRPAPQAGRRPSLVFLLVDYWVLIAQERWKDGLLARAAR